MRSLAPNLLQAYPRLASSIASRGQDLPAFAGRFHNLNCEMVDGIDSMTQAVQMAAQHAATCDSLQGLQNHPIIRLDHDAAGTVMLKVDTPLESPVSIEAIDIGEGSLYMRIPPEFAEEQPRASSRAFLVGDTLAIARSYTTPNGCVRLEAQFELNLEGAMCLPVADTDDQICVTGQLTISSQSGVSSRGTLILRLPCVPGLRCDLVNIECWHCHGIVQCLAEIMDSVQGALAVSVCQFLTF